MTITTTTEARAVLNWVNVFARNLEDLPAFYSDLFGLAEIEYMRNDVFRGFDVGGAGLGFLAPEVYDLLTLGEEDTAGVSFLLNFEAASIAEVDELVTKAIAAGATLVKKPFETGYGWYQSVLADPEGNIFRINKILRGPAAVSG